MSSSLPQWGQSTVMVIMDSSASPTIFAFTLPHHSLFHHYPMHAAWVAFANKGDPGWPKYDLTRRATMYFDTTSEVVDDPGSAERMLWEGLR